MINIILFFIIIILFIFYIGEFNSENRSIIINLKIILNNL